MWNSNRRSNNLFPALVPLETLLAMDISIYLMGGNKISAGQKAEGKSERKWYLRHRNLLWECLLWGYQMNICFGNIFMNNFFGNICYGNVYLNIFYTNIFYMNIFKNIPVEKLYSCPRLVLSYTEGIILQPLVGKKSFPMSAPET